MLNHDSLGGCKSWRIARYIDTLLFLPELLPGWLRSCRKGELRENYCEISICEVLFIVKVDLDTNGNRKLKAYCTWTCTTLPGL